MSDVTFNNGHVAVMTDTTGGRANVWVSDDKKMYTTWINDDHRESIADAIYCGHTFTPRGDWQFGREDGIYMCAYGEKAVFLVSCSGTWYWSDGHVVLHAEYVSDAPCRIADIPAEWKKVV